MKVELPTRSLDLRSARVMGILNTTPDSFYDHGRYAQLEEAIRHAEDMAEEGAHVIDIGGEKAGPGDPVSVEEELRRVIPAIEGVKKRVSLPISVDTFKPEVARHAIESGADIINSIGGFRDPSMREVAATTGAAIVIMHIQGEPRVSNPSPHYENVVEDVEAFLRKQVRECLDAGISSSRIIIDPGPGFGKTSQHDLQILSGIRRLTDMGYPVLLAVSRKKFIGEVLGLPEDERLEGSLAATAWGVLHGVKIVRAHDVRATRQVVDMTEAVLHPNTVEART